MSARTARRRRRQHRIGFTHIAKICGGSIAGGRPIYRHRQLLNVSDAIAAERRRAAQEQARKAKKR